MRHLSLWCPSDRPTNPLRRRNVRPRFVCGPSVRSRHTWRSQLSHRRPVPPQATNGSVYTRSLPHLRGSVGTEYQGRWVGDDVGEFPTPPPACRVAHTAYPSLRAGAFKVPHNENAIFLTKPCHNHCVTVPCNYAKPMRCSNDFKAQIVPRQPRCHPPPRALPTLHRAAAMSCPELSPWPTVLMTNKDQ